VIESVIVNVLKDLKVHCRWAWCMKLFGNILS